MKIFYLISLIALLTCCQSVKKTSSASFEETAKERFGQAATIRYNQDGNFALVYANNKQGNKMPFSALHYGLYDVKTKQLLFSEQKRGGSVEWADANHIMVKSKPEVQSIDPEQNKQMAVYYINVKTLEKAYELNE